MDRGACSATVHGGHKELDRTEHTHIHTQEPLTFSQVHLVKTDSLEQ